MTMVGCSATYHLARDPHRKALLRRCDHAAIFAMIAGTYTGLLAQALPNMHATGILAMVWLIALVGMAIKLSAIRLPEWFSVVIYLALGWIILLDPAPLLAILSFHDRVLVAVGGLLYSLGVLFYAWQRLPFHTAIWHGMVLCAATCHYVVVLGLTLE